jgi:hypothetical protein
MTDEALFYRRFVDDVRSCAGGRAPACVAEIERRIRVALIASPSARERRWARVVAAVNELLAGLDRNSPPAERLRAFARENADLGRSRDVAITDFCFVPQAETIVTTREGRSYLLFTRVARARTSPPLGSLDEVVPAGTRRVAEWAVYALCGSAALAALWFAFIVPV